MNPRLPFACLATLVLAAYASSVRANGRFPAANQLLINPTDPSHFVVRTTFGFVETTDAGKSFRWICEGVVSPDGVQDPPLAVTGDGTLVVAVPFEGVTVSHDHGCSWAYAPAPLADRFAVDVTLEPTNPSGLLALTSTGDNSIPSENEPEFINLLVETRDDARSWSLLGSPLPRDFIAAAFEVARSRPERIYVSGVVGDPLNAVIERSDDRGVTWTRLAMPLPDHPFGVFLSAIHPGDPDKLWVRVRFAPDVNGSTPTSLFRSDDGGESWTEVATTADGMFGFALSPDGEALAFGSSAGVFTGPATGQAFAPLATLSNRCLTWSRAGLYACATEPADPFAVGIARPQSDEFEALYRLADTCPQECPEASHFALTCRRPWSDALGVAALTQAQGKGCRVGWGPNSSEAGSGGSSSGGARTEASGGNAGGEAATALEKKTARGACALAYGASSPEVSWVVAALVLTSIRSRQRRRHRRAVPWRELRKTGGSTHRAAVGCGASRAGRRPSVAPFRRALALETLRRFRHAP